MDFSKVPNSEKGEMVDCMDFEDISYTTNDFQIAFEKNRGMEWENDNLQSVLTVPHRFSQEIPMTHLD